MLNIDFNCRFYTDEMLDKLSSDFRENGVDYDREFLEEVAQGSLLVNGLDGIGPLNNHPTNAGIVLQNLYDKPTPDSGFIGAMAIDYLLKLTDTETDVKPISGIHIPMDVFYECSSSTWYDICTLAANANNRVNRYMKMCELNAPPIIITNEYRMAYEAINKLCCNGYNGTIPLERCYGIAIRSLSDIGYSLAYGWNDKMKAFFEERDAKFEAEMENEANADQEGESDE